MSLLFLIMQIAGYSLGGVLILIAVIYFFAADVKGDLAILTGQRARRQIKQISQSKEESERLRAAGEKGRGRQGKDTALRTSHARVPAVPDVSESLFSERLSDDQPTASPNGETVVLMQETPPIADGAGETTVLSPDAVQPTAMPQPDRRREATQEAAPVEGTLMEMSGVRVPIETIIHIKLIHTAEIIN